MGYRIEYPCVKKVCHAEKRRSRRLAMTGILFVLFLGVTQAFWPEGWLYLQEALLPGDNAVTAAALENLSFELRSGADLQEALRQFCCSILQGA